jgi:hypothetical protein
MKRKTKQVSDWMYYDPILEEFCLGFHGMCLSGIREVVELPAGTQAIRIHVSTKKQHPQDLWIDVATERHGKKSKYSWHRVLDAESCRSGDWAMPLESTLTYGLLDLLIGDLIPLDDSLFEFTRLYYHIEYK